VENTPEDAEKLIYGLNDISLRQRNRTSRLPAREMDKLLNDYSLQHRALVFG
jgi:hypothetical protein